MDNVKAKTGITYKHEDGQTVFTNRLNDETFTAQWSEYPQEILDRLLEYGIQQKFSDFKVGHFSGKEPLLSKEERLSVMEELDEMLRNGEWKMKRESGQAISKDKLVEAMMQMDESARQQFADVFKESNPKVWEMLNNKLNG